MAPNTDRHAFHATDEVFVAPDPIPSFPAPTPYDEEAQAVARSRIDEIFGEIEEEMRLEAERAEQERIAREEAERRERERLEAERIAREEAERLEQERIEAEQRAREEAERLERERLEAERLERERLEAERREREEQERREREEAERREREAAEAARREELARQLAAAAAASHMAPIDEESFGRLEDRPRRGAHFALVTDEDETTDKSVEESLPADETDAIIDEASVDTPEVESTTAVTEPEVAEFELLTEAKAKDVPASPLFEEMSLDAAEAVDSLDDLSAFDGIPTETAEVAPAEEMPARTSKATFDDTLLGLHEFDDFDELDEANVEEEEEEDYDDLDEASADVADGGVRPAVRGTYADFGDFDDLDEPEVVVIYDEDQIKEAAVDEPAASSGADAGLEATLVLDRVADAVKKLRVEGESAPVAPVREQKAEPEIHTEFQVSDDDKERLEVRKRSVASTKGRQGGGFFARIGAFVVKALHLDER